MKHHFRPRIVRFAGRTRSAAGFTLLEVIITVSMFVFLSTMLLMNYRNINKRILLDTAADGIGQSIREAQVFAMGVRGQIDGSSLVYLPYGLHFDRNSDTYILFYDRDLDSKYKTNPACGQNNTECVRPVKLEKGMRVTKICGGGNGAVAQGDCPSGQSQIPGVSIIFRRPIPDAWIYDEASPTSHQFSSAVITLESGTGTAAYSRTITAYLTGQIALK